MLGYVPISADVEKVARTRVDCGMHVRRELGPGFKEGIYERALCLELDARGVRFESEKPILVKYKSWEIPGQKIDLLVAGVVLVEIKAVLRVRQIYVQQTVSYLKTLDLRLGLLMNFSHRLSKMA